MALPPMHRMTYPIETKEAYAFWASKHLCNRLKAIISFSVDEEDANHNMKRFGYQTHLRHRALNAWKNYVAMPDMAKIPFSEMETPWWECLPDSVQPGPTGKWTLWDDTKDWEDAENWKEWTPDPDPIP